MASLAVASTVNIASSASSLSGARVTAASRNVSTSVKMAPVRCQANSEAEVVHRRAVVAGAAAAVLALVSSVPAKAAEPEPKNGSKEAKRIYANICVTMPTAKVCHG